MTIIIRVGLFATVFFALTSNAQDPVDLLPDVITNPATLMDTEIVHDVEPGRVHLLLSNSTPNIGEGPLEVFGVPPKDTGDVETQPVKQRIHRSDGSYYDRDAGFFEYHPSHHHIHFQDWCRYRLRSDSSE